MRLMPHRRNRGIVALQLTAMIDIFSLIVIFLVKGTVFGVADVPVPREVKLPQSISKESVESAPQIVIVRDHVRVSTGGGSLPLELFRESGKADQRFLALKERMVDFIAKLPAEARSSGVLLNVIADRSTSYRDIYDTVSAFKQFGFETLLFIGNGGNGANDGS